MKEAIQMAKILVDNKEVELNGERNLLEVIRKAGINLPTFCYHSELSIYGACRMCTVEVEKMGLVAACSTPPTDGMVVYTNTDRTRRLRRMVIELLLADHHRDCTTCDKNGSCKLQELAYQLGVRKVRFPEKTELKPIDTSSTGLVRDPNKCILCGDCVRMCSEVQGIGVLTFANRGSKTEVTPAFSKPMAEVDCVSCGQCVSVCPTGALTVKSEKEAVRKALDDQTKTVVVQIAPAVRVAVGDAFGEKHGEAVTGKIVTALRRMGFNKVFDTVITADLTAIEETTEFIDRVQNNRNLPQFTSCCPGWVKYCEQFHPDLLDNLSTCKSPQQMFGAVAKRFYAKEIGVEPQDLFLVSVMPCTAKKFEAQRPEFSIDGVRDVDAVLSTVELIQMIQESGLVFEELEGEAFDAPLGLASGAGVIFGVTGGVAEAALRTAAGILGGDGPHQIDFREVRGFEGIKEAVVTVGGIELKLAVVSGLANTERLIQAVKDGKANYHLIEVMTCPGGCVGGGGQPVSTDGKARISRGKSLYAVDKEMPFRTPLENLAVNQMYDKWLEKPGSHISHESLHTTYGPKRRINGAEIQIENSPQAVVDVAVCVGTGCYLRGAYEVLDQFTDLADSDKYAGLVNLKATFCLENCDKGVSVKVGDKLITGVNKDTAAATFRREVDALLK
jgi:NADH-quinone oxidoreductase subunit G